MDASGRASSEEASPRRSADETGHSYSGAEIEWSSRAPIADACRGRPGRLSRNVGRSFTFCWAAGASHATQSHLDRPRAISLPNSTRWSRGPLRTIH